MFQLVSDQRLAHAKLQASAHTFHPNHTVKCHGKPLFRSQQARNLACAFDLDTNVLAWSCLPVALHFDGNYHIPDFAITHEDGDYLIDAMPPPDWVLHKTKDDRWLYNCNFYNDAFIANAVDLLPFANATITLNDRLRILTALEDHGTLALKYCCQIVRNSSDPVAALAALYFSHEIIFDLTERIDPETRVSRV